MLIWSGGSVWRVGCLYLPTFIDPTCQGWRGLAHIEDSTLRADVQLYIGVCVPIKSCKISKKANVNLFEDFCSKLPNSIQAKMRFDSFLVLH